MSNRIILSNSNDKTSKICKVLCPECYSIDFEVEINFIENIDDVGMFQLQNYCYNCGVNKYFEKGVHGTWSESTL